jgi:cell division protein FtsB
MSARTRAGGQGRGASVAAKRGHGGPGPLRRLVSSDLALGLLLVGSLVLGTVLLAAPFENYVSARQRVALLAQQASALDAENQRLERRLDDLDDPVILELLAREQQGLIRSGEVPYVLLPPEAERPRIVDAPPVVAGPEEDILDRILTWLQRLLG